MRCSACLGWRRSLPRDIHVNVCDHVHVSVYKSSQSFCCSHDVITLFEWESCIVASVLTLMIQSWQWETCMQAVLICNVPGRAQFHQIVTLYSRKLSRHSVQPLHRLRHFKAYQYFLSLVSIFYKRTHRPNSLFWCWELIMPDSISWLELHIGTYIHWELIMPDSISWLKLHILWSFLWWNTQITKQQQNLPRVGSPRWLNSYVWPKVEMMILANPSHG